ERIEVLAGRQVGAAPAGEHPLDLPELGGSTDPLGDVADTYADRAMLDTGGFGANKAESGALELLVNQLDRLIAEAAKQTRHLDEIRAHMRIFFWVYVVLPLVCGVIWFLIYLAARGTGGS